MLVSDDSDIDAAAGRRDKVFGDLLGAGVDVGRRRRLVPAIDQHVRRLSRIVSRKCEQEAVAMADPVHAHNGDPNQEQRIIVTGGLPELPGTEVIMPQLNGQHLELTAAKDPVPDSVLPDSQINEESKPK
jgi:hypothetical protein